MSLRAAFTTMTVVSLSLSFLVLSALVALTTLLHDATSSATSSVESVRLTQEVEIDLFLHARAGDPLVRGAMEQRIVEKLRATQAFVTTPHEAEIFEAAERAVHAYLETCAPGGASDERIRQETAFVALDALLAENVRQAREAAATAEVWDRAANLLAIGVGGLLVAAAVTLLVWLKRGAFAPVLSLGSAMERFGRGARDARADESGPRELREMSRTFNEMAAALEAQHRAQVAFLGGVAHDLRTPLSVLKMSVALVPADRPLPPEPRLRELLAKIRRQIERLERMADDFLEVSRIEAGELTLRVGQHDIGALLEEVVGLFEGTKPEPHLRVFVPDAPVVIRCDKLRLEQVLINLVSNAIKYAPVGSPVDLSLDASEDEVIVSVRDRGVGIAPDQVERAFEPFKRLGASKGEVQGVGLGLFVVRQLVRAHGGRIDVESAPGRGSTFRVALPRGLDVGVASRDRALHARPSDVALGEPSPRFS